MGHTRSPPSPGQPGQQRIWTVSAGTDHFRFVVERQGLGVSRGSWAGSRSQVPAEAMSMAPWRRNRGEPLSPWPDRNRMALRSWLSGSPIWTTTSLWPVGTAGF